MTKRKLDQALKYEHSITFTGRGRFPMDMLRYDRCSPKTESDSNTACNQDKFRDVTVVRHTPGAKPVWNFDRWASFGWRQVK